ncbi:hypothetical protein [Lentibacillus sp. CBA3610]|uniref:hypothetical protein n=1 Tax=Lentibacillus sp. CBA3610 TaxID=2518176 RepID=UPI0015958CE5|nr:hypothetical protein [Lentibacillus sp. CBA3610]QKY70786.1 hypothetical protein Len3610_15420 [Lentibacillus sp. CBA3610]
MDIPIVIATIRGGHLSHPRWGDGHRKYLVPVLLLTTIGGFVTIFFLLWISPRLFPDDKLSNLLGFFGMQTGTISTGMALVKAVDPGFQSNTAENLVLGSTTAMTFGFPLLLLLNVPIVGYVQNEPIMYVYTFLGLLVYFMVLGWCVALQDTESKCMSGVGHPTLPYLYLKLLTETSDALSPHHTKT